MKRIDITNLATATAQQVFDTVATHLLKQNKQCTTTGIGCAYRVEKGKKGKVLKCAAGCLIPRRLYQPTLEKKTWSYLVSNQLVPAHHQSLVSQLQGIHDNNEVSQWKTKLIELAQSLGLSAATVEA